MKTNADTLHDNRNTIIRQWSKIKLRTSGRIQVLWTGSRA